LVGYDALRARLERVGHCDRKLMQMLLSQSEREAKLLAPRRTGNLRRSIGSALEGDTKGKLFARADYAADVEFGTRAHDITPNAKRALRFATGSGARLTGSPRVGAGVVFAMRVHHPGTKPHPYLAQGARTAVKSSNLSEIIVAAWEGK
jgi:hypothetical protein